DSNPCYRRERAASWTPRRMRRDGRGGGRYLTELPRSRAGNLLPERDIPGDVVVRWSLSVGRCPLVVVRWSLSVGRWWLSVVGCPVLCRRSDAPCIDIAVIASSSQH